MARQVEVEKEKQIVKKEKILQWQADDGAVCESKETAEEYEYWKDRLIPVASIPLVCQEFLTSYPGEARLYWVFLEDEKDRSRLARAKFPTLCHNREGLWDYHVHAPAGIPLKEWTLIGWTQEHDDYSSPFVCSRQRVLGKVQKAQEELNRFLTQVARLGEEDDAEQPIR